MRPYQPVLAEYRNLASRVGGMAGDFWTVYTDYYDGRQFRPLGLVWIPLCELPLVRLPETVPLYKPISDYFRSFLHSEQSNSHRQ
jgi:hypothetical protein